MIRLSRVVTTCVGDMRQKSTDGFKFKDPPDKSRKIKSPIYRVLRNF